MVEKQTLRVLVIEDDADARANICDILELSGHVPLATATFAEAFATGDSHLIDAVLTDRKLPDGLAEQKLPELHQLAPGADVIVMTGFPDINGAIGALRAGAYDYILKPINPDELLASLRRIGEHRQTQYTLRDRDERLKAILEAASDAILTLDANCRIKSVNPAVERLFGFSAQQLVGERVDLLLPHPAGTQENCQWLRTAGQRTDFAARNPILNARRQCGDTVPVELTIAEVDHLDLYIIIIRDISERRELQRQLLEIAAEEDRRIGHELHDNIQQQLTGLSLLARTLADRLARENSSGAPQASRLASEIAETARQVNLLARGLVPVEVDAHGLRAALASLAQRVSELHQLRCEFRHEGPLIVADNFVATHLYRIAQEAIQNALKHGQARRIVVTLGQRDHHFVLEVDDDGRGIEMSQGFQPGMGLRIMSYRAGLIGGTLDIVRKEGSGTRLTCMVWQTE